MPPRSHRIWRAWASYWLAPGGRLSLAVLRIALATSLLWMLWRYHDGWDFSSARYYKLGPWLLWPGGRPGPGLVHVLTVIAWLSTSAMLVGLFSRASHAVSLFCLIALAAYGVSDAPTWSHYDVPPLLASFAFLGARSGDTISLDALLRRRRGVTVPSPRQTSARLVQLTVVSVFFVAALWKLRTGGLAFGWALSDNMRHQLLARYDWISAERPPLANWLIDSAWRYRTAATLNMISQLTPISAPFLFRYPRLRALLAILFILEVLGLGYVMLLWNLHWLPLAAAFVDWDALAAWVRRKRGQLTDEPLVSSSPRRARAHLAFVTTFLLFYSLQAVWLNQRLRAFPFSSFPLFATLRAKQPLDEHQTYELLGGHIEVLGNRPLLPEEDVFLHTRVTYRWMFRARDHKTVAQDLHVILDDVRRIWPSLDIKGVRLWLSVYQAPAYPAAARLDRHDLGILGEMYLDERVHTALGSLGADGMTVTSTESVEVAGARASVSLDLAPTPTPLASTTTATGLVLSSPLVGDPAYLVVTDRDGTPWIAGFRSRGSY
ncbi:hypothetical protein BH11MYX2_BH11MYX2_22840 [soil metagenome]